MTSVTRASRPVETGAPSTIVCPPSSLPAAREPSTRRSVATCVPPSEDEKRSRYAISATASPLVSILSSYSASGANGSAVVGPRGFSPTDGCRFMIKIDLPASPGFGKASRSVRSRRASPMGEHRVGIGIMVRHRSSAPVYAAGPFRARCDVFGEDKSQSIAFSSNGHHRERRSRRRWQRHPSSSRPWNVFPLPATLLEFLLRAAGHRLIPLGRRGVPDDVARWIVAARC